MHELLLVVAFLVLEHRLWSVQPSGAGALALELRAQQLWHTGSAALWHVGLFRTRDRTCVSCVGRQVLNHRATRKSQIGVLLVQI